MDPMLFQSRKYLIHQKAFLGADRFERFLPKACSFNGFRKGWLYTLCIHSLEEPVGGDIIFLSNLREGLLEILHLVALGSEGTQNLINGHLNSCRELLEVNLLRMGYGRRDFTFLPFVIIPSLNSFAPNPFSAHKSVRFPELAVLRT